MHFKLFCKNRENPGGIAGKVTKVENMDIVKVTLKVEKVLKYKHEYEGNEYLTFEMPACSSPTNLTAPTGQN